MQAAAGAARRAGESPVSATACGFATRKNAGVPRGLDLGGIHFARKRYKDRRSRLAFGGSLMRILQPAEWAKPRGFSHGVAVDGPGRWIVLAGQTGGDEKGEYVTGDMAGQVGTALRRIVKLLAEARAGPEHIVRLTWY